MLLEIRFGSCEKRNDRHRFSRLQNAAIAIYVCVGASSLSRGEQNMPVASGI